MFLKPVLVMVAAGLRISTKSALLTEINNYIAIHYVLCNGQFSVWLFGVW
jgi:hypothetical protein